MDEIINKTELVLPSNKLDLKNKHWNVSWVFALVLAFLAISSIVTALMGDAEGLLLGGFLFVICLIALTSNLINIDENDKPRLFIGEHGFRFNHRGMPEIKWNQVTNVGFKVTNKTNAPNEDENIFVKVSIKTKDDSLYFPSLSSKEKFFLRKSSHYYWPEIAIELTYDQARTFASLALIRSNLIINKEADIDLIKSLKKHFKPITNIEDFQYKLDNIPVLNDLNTDLPGNSEYRTNNI